MRRPPLFSTTSPASAHARHDHSAQFSTLTGRGGVYGPYSAAHGGYYGAAPSGRHVVGMPTGESQRDVARYVDSVRAGVSSDTAAAAVAARSVEYSPAGKAALAANAIRAAGSHAPAVPPFGMYEHGSASSAAARAGLTRAESPRTGPAAAVSPLAAAAGPRERDHVLGQQRRHAYTYVIASPPSEAHDAVPESPFKHDLHRLYNRIDSVQGSLSLSARKHETALDRRILAVERRSDDAATRLSADINAATDSAERIAAALERERQAREVRRLP